MNSGRIITSRVYPDQDRRAWEDEFLSQIAKVLSLRLDVIEHGDVIERTINPINIESARILEES